MICEHLNDFSDGHGHEKMLILTRMGTGMEIYFAGTDGDGDRVERGQLWTDGDVDKCSSPCRALV